MPWGRQRRHAGWPRPRHTAAEASCAGPGLYGVLRTEAVLARKAIGEPRDSRPPDATGWYGRGRPGPAVKVALLGDSSAAGYGVERVEETPGAQIASGLAVRRRPPGPPAVLRGGGRAVGPPRGPARRRAAHRPGPRGAADRRQRHHPPGAPGDLDPAPLRGRTPAARRPAPRSSSAPAPTSARSVRSRRRSSRWRDCGRAGWRPPRRSPWSSGAAAACRSATSSARSSTPRRRCSSARTGSTPPPTATARWPTCCCPRPRGAWSRPGRGGAARGAARRGPAPDRQRGRRGGRTPGTELDGVEVAGARRGVRGLWVELRHRRRHPETATEAPQDSQRARRADRRADRWATTGPAPGPGHENGPPGLPGGPLVSLGRWRQSCWKIARMRSRLV